MPDVVRALVPHVPGVLHALVPHVLPCLTCCVTYVPHMPRTLGGLVSLVTHLLQVHHAKHTIMHLIFRSSRASRLLCF